MKELIRKILLNEGRKEDLYQKYKSYIEEDKQGQEDYEFLINHSFMVKTNYKYLDWVLKRWYVGDTNETKYYSTLDDLVHLVKFFHEISTRYPKELPSNDINFYKIPIDLQNELDRIDFEIEERENIKRAKKDVKRVFDDEDFLVIKPLTHYSSCAYGGGTKWCTASKDSDTAFVNYTQNRFLYYIIDKHKKQNHPLYKIAVLITKNGTYEMYNAPDIKINEGGLLGLYNYLPKELVDSIKTDMGYNDQMINKDSNDMGVHHEIFTDIIGNGYWYRVNGETWRITIDQMSGVADWVCDDYPYFVFHATPNWENDNEIPLAGFNNETEDYLNFQSDIEIPIFTGTRWREELFDWYETEYFRQVHGEIKTFLRDFLD